MPNIKSIWKARILAVLAGVLFFFIYTTTLTIGFYPGESARNVSIALGLEPCTVALGFEHVKKADITGVISKNDESANLAIDDAVFEFHTKYAVWQTVGNTLARIPFGHLAERLNTFAAIFGAICVMLAFSLFRALPLLLAFHDSPVSAKYRKRSAYLAAISGVVAFGMSTPFWLASTRFLPQTFECLVFLVMAMTLFHAVIKHSSTPLVLFGLLLGLSIFESDAGIYLLPVWFFVVIRGMRVGELNDSHGWFNLLVGICAGIVSYMMIYSFCIPLAPHVATMLPVKELFLSIKYLAMQWVAGGIFENQHMLTSLLFVTIPFVSTIALCIWRMSDNAGSSSGLLLFCLVCTSTAAIIKTSVSPWGAASGSSEAALPAALYLLNAFVVSFLTARGALMADGRFFSSKKTAKSVFNDGEAVNAGTDHTVGRLLVVYTFVLVVGVGVSNVHEVNSWRDSFPDRYACEIASNLSPCTWIASKTDVFDSLIKVHAKMIRQHPTIFCTAVPAGKNAKFLSALKRDKVFNGLDSALLRDALTTTNSQFFIQTWIKNDENVGKKLFVLDSREILNAGKYSIASVAGYKIAVPGEKTDWGALAEKHIKFLTEVQSLKPLDNEAPIWLRSLRAEIRVHISEIGKQLSASLRENGLNEKASEVLDLAIKIMDEPVPDEQQSFEYIY